MDKGKYFDSTTNQFYNRVAVLSPYRTFAQSPSWSKWCENGDPEPEGAADCCGPGASSNPRCRNYHCDCQVNGSIQWMTTDQGSILSVPSGAKIETRIDQSDNYCSAGKPGESKGFSDVCQAPCSSND